jgi:hypothetical protein
MLVVDVPCSILYVNKKNQRIFNGIYRHETSSLQQLTERKKLPFWIRRFLTVKKIISDSIEKCVLNVFEWQKDWLESYHYIKMFLRWWCDDEDATHWNSLILFSSLEIHLKIFCVNKNLTCAKSYFEWFCKFHYDGSDVNISQLSLIAMINRSFQGDRGVFFSNCLIKIFTALWCGNW